MTVNTLKRSAVISLATLLVAGVVCAAEDNVIRQPAVAVQDEAKSASDLRRELDETRKEAQANAQRAAQAEKEAQQTAQQQAKTSQQTAQPQAAQPQGEQPQAGAQTVTYGGGFISLSRMRVSTDKKDGDWAADVTCAITLNHVENVPFVYQAVLVSADGKPHTDIQGRTYQASREVSTGDDEDTDKYTVTIPLAGLFTSRPPELYVQTRLVDGQGRIVAASPLQYFPMPR
jgi:hypothetical protein